MTTPHSPFWMISASRSILCLAAVAMAAGLSGCADGDAEVTINDPFGDSVVFVPGGGAPIGGGVPGGGSGGPSEGGTKPEGDAQSGPGGGTDTGPVVSFSGLEIIFLHDTSQPVGASPSEHQPLAVKVIDYGSGGPANGALLSWTIIDAVGPGAPGDAYLSSDATFTGPSGQSSVMLFTGASEQVLYTVEVAADGAVPRTAQVRVDPLPKADLRVDMSYEGPIALNNVSVRLMPGSFSCGQFMATNPPAGLSEKTVLSPNSQPLFTGLEANKKYTVIATAKGPSGSLAGAGCRDGIYVEAGILNIVEMKLWVLALNPAGNYDLTNVFDFTGAVPGQLGQILDSLAKLFYNPGAFLVEQIKNLIKQFIPGFITDAIFGLFEKQLAKIITDWVLNDAPSWVQDFFTIGQDLLQVVAKLELTGLLKISKLQNEYYVEGNISFTGVVLSWKLGCDKTSPDYEACGKYPFSLTDSSSGFPLDILSSNWQGSISKVDQLTVDKHTLALNYGKIILFVLSDLILKNLTGKNTLAEAVAAMIGCEGIAKALSGLGLFGKDTIQNACEGAVTLLVMPLQSVLLGLETDSLVSLQGSATLRDTTNNLIVDKIIDGKWQGFILVGGASGNPFSGTWFADRK